MDSIRNGASDAWRELSAYCCSARGVERFTERACRPIELFENMKYRHLLKQSHDAAQEELARFTLDTLCPTSQRGVVSLLTPDNVAVVSTPNRRDILMKQHPYSLPRFCYRTWHPWTLNPGSYVAMHTYLQVYKLHHVHPFGLVNTMHWLKEGCPRGRTPRAPLHGAIDRYWLTWLLSADSTDSLNLIAYCAHDGDRR